MTLTLTMAAVLAGAVGGAVVWRFPDDIGVPWLPRWLGPLLVIAAGLLAAGGVGFAVVVGMVLFGRLYFFGIIHLAYLGLCVAVPIVGSAVVVRTVTGRLTGWSAALAVGLLVPVPIGWYATHVEPYRLGVDEVTFQVDPARAGEDPVRIGVLADLQTNNPGAHERKAIDRLLEAEPDIILIPGDLFQGSLAELDRHEEEMRELVGRLAAPGGVYFVQGDTDHWGRADRILEGSDIEVLDDEIVEVSVGDRRILLGGNPLDFWSDSAAAVHQELENAPGDDTIRILMAHRPDVVLGRPEGSRIDLTVAGHTHGGQVVIPGFGPLITMSEVPRHVARGGLHQIAGNDIYVSTGVGLERAQAPQVRFLSQPTIGLVDLQ